MRRTVIIVGGSLQLGGVVLETGLNTSEFNLYMCGWM
jgi:hypothetical protein